MKTFLLLTLPLSLFLSEQCTSQEIAFHFFVQRLLYTNEEPRLLHAWCFMFKHAY